VMGSGDLLPRWQMHVAARDEEDYDDDTEVCRGKNLTLVGCLLARVGRRLI
jgi:hypothetical protein